jgi:hypothetical protein
VIDTMDKRSSGVNRRFILILNSHGDGSRHRIQSTKSYSQLDSIIVLIGLDVLPCSIQAESQVTCRPPPRLVYRSRNTAASLTLSLQFL